LPQLTLKGTVFSGIGEGRRFVALPWVKVQIERKLGFTPYFGTLNLRLTEDSAQKRKLFDTAEGFLIEPERGYLPGVLFQASIEGLECAVVLPRMPDYPADVLEIVAPQYLRDKLGLVDGSRVAVVVTF
jgi:riboflavin kinase